MKAKSDMPLVAQIESHIERHPVSLHVPGHKNGVLYSGSWHDVLKYDLTEISGLDDLHYPQGAIKEAETYLKNYYHSVKSHFLVNGTSGGNLAMILATVEAGERVFVPRDAHKSILNGLELVGAEPIFLTPQIDWQIGVASGIRARDLTEAFNAFPDVKVCLFTYPSYYGTVFDLQSCITIAHQHGAVVLVDEAHGAHFTVSDVFPPSALSLGADIVTQSAHKTLPALTMGSFIHQCSNHPKINRLEHYLQVIQTSSPSYLIMASLDAACHYCATYTLSDLAAFTKMRSKWLRFLEKQGFELILPADLLKIIIRKVGYTGTEIAAILEANGYYPELVDERQVLLILPLIKRGTEFSPMGKWFIEERSNKQIIPEKKATQTSAWMQLEITFTEMANKQTEFIALKFAVGRIAAETIMPYPPGIPEIIRGEKISSFHVKHLLQLAGRQHQGGERLQENLIQVFI